MIGRYFWWGVSLLFHPLLMITWASLFLFELHPYYKIKFFDEQKYYILLAVFINTFLLPVFATFLLKWGGIISSIKLEERKDRIIPFFLAIVFVSITSQQLYTNSLEGTLFRFMLGTALCIAVALVVNFFFKISAHAIAVSGFCALALYSVVIEGYGELSVVLIFIPIVAGLTGSSRLALHAHTKSEVYLGFVVGFAVVFLSLLL